MDGRLLPGTASLHLSFIRVALVLFPRFSLTCCSVLTQNLSYPQWTYGEYAFPAIDLHDIKYNTSQNNTENGTLAEGSLLTVILPAIRGFLNCSSVPQDDVQIDFDSQGINFDVSSATTPNCPKWPNAFGCSDYKVSGEAIPLKVGDYFDCSSQYLEPANGTLENNHPPLYAGCAMLWFVYGQLLAPNQTTGTSILACRPYMAQLSVELSFVPPDFAIDITNPPKQVPNTEKILFSDFISGASLLIQPVAPNLGQTTPFLNFKTSVDTDGLHLWFKALIYGVDGVPAASLLGSENAPTLIANLDRVFGVWMAQILGSYARTTTPSSEIIPTSLPTYNASLKDPSSARLVQSQVSTRIVQVLLGTMIVCAIIAFWKQDTRNVLPKNPGCIAAVASLVADSNLLSGYDHRQNDSDRNGSFYFSPGVEFGSEKDLVKVFEGWVFSMGWWERKNETPKFVIDVGQYDGKNFEDLRQNNEDPLPHSRSPQDAR